MKFLLLLTLAATSYAILAPFYDAGKNGVKGRYIVVLQDDVNLDGTADRFLAIAAQSDLIATIKRKLPVLNAFVTTFPESALDILRSLPGVAYVEEDEIITVKSVKSWGLDRVDQKDLPLDNSYSVNGDGTDVTVYVIDSGINPNHIDLAGRVTGIIDYLDGDGIDCNGHGTHCSGTAVGSEYGVAKGANVVSIRTLDCNGSGYKSDSTAALEWIAANAEIPSVVSLSLGGATSRAQDAAVAKCKDAGFVVVVAAGNENDDACQYSPARADSAITVGATTDSDQRWWWSNYGECVDIFAPGQGITSLVHYNNYGTVSFSGTSMACPHVAGIAAIKAAEEFKKSEGNYDVLNVYDAIISSATPNKVGSPGAKSPNLLAFVE